MTNTKEKSVELRSEKVRNIIGEIPPALTRHGTSIIALSVIILLSISTFFPYRKILAGIVRIKDIPQSASDTTRLSVEFVIPQIKNENLKGTKIILYSEKQSIEGRVCNYDSTKNNAILSLPSSMCIFLENREVEFKIITSEVSILVYLIHSLNINDNQ